MSGYFPEDVLISILARFPVATVLRCTAVCKSWYSLISSPLFISTHFEFNSAKTHLLLRYCDGERVLDKKENYDLYVDNNDTFEGYRKFEFPFIGVNDYFRIVGSCNGLVCLTDDMGEYNLTTIIWNPSIKKSVVLPEPRVTFTLHGACSHTHGFGFDRLTNDYKVVRIVNIWLNDGPPQVELYELSKGRWRDISPSASGFRCRVGATAPAALVGGILHWAAMDESFRNIILSFDLSKEVFGEILMPESVASASLRYFTDLRAGMYKESLAVFVHGTYSVSPYCCVWVMEEYGNVESWTQLFSISHLRLGFQLLVGFRRNGEALFVDRDKCFAMFDPKELVIEYLDIHGSYLHAFYASSYTESLVFMDKSVEWSDTNTVRDLLLNHSIEDDAEQCTRS